MDGLQSTFITDLGPYYHGSHSQAVPRCHAICRFIASLLCPQNSPSFAQTELLPSHAWSYVASTGFVVMHDDVIDGGATIVKLDSRARGADR